MWYIISLSVYPESVQSLKISEVRTELCLARGAAIVVNDIIITILVVMITLIIIILLLLLLLLVIITIIMMIIVALGVSRTGGIQILKGSTLKGSIRLVAKAHEHLANWRCAAMVTYIAL